MKKLKKPFMLAVAVILMMATVLVGCSGNNGNESEPTPTKEPQEDKTSGNGDKKEDPAGDKWVLGEKPFKFSAYAHYPNDFPDWETTPFGKWLKEEKQVEVDVVKAGGQHVAKLATMMSTGELPDLIWTDRFHPEMDRLREAGKLVAFDEYLDKYPNLKEWMGDDLNMLRHEDGKLYQFPNWYTSQPNGSAGYVVNKKIYEELGKPPLQTTDDLYAYLKAVKEEYGDSIVPFEPDRAQDANGLGVLYTAFGEDKEALYSYLNRSILSVPKGDKLTSILDDPIFREAQKYISKLYREKLISQEAFNQTRDQVEEKVMAGRVAVYAAANPTQYASTAHYEMIKDDPDSGYFMIKPIHKPGLDQDKIKAGTYTSFGWNAAYITTAAEDPEALFAFLDFMTSPEGMNVQFFGPEGLYWDGFDENGLPNFTENYDQEEVSKFDPENSQIMLVGNTAYINPAKYKYMKTLPFDEQDWTTKYMQTITLPSQANVTEFVGLDPAPDSDEGIIKTSVDEIFLEYYTNSATASSDEEVDKILDKGSQALKDAGYDKLLEWRSAKWQENLKTLSGNE
ncbi:ABC transporter substrate-binding protein [Paenibacillus chungangensis]|uniref:ABC transporter substrate-binding protein n=1 Tax=Paenibacillus chungangensis TaxID=696535 RepID=A0ABW3HLF0_9BACL